MELTPLVTALIGLITTVLVGLLKKGFDFIDKLQPLAKQGVVLGVATTLVVVFHFFDFGLVPETYRTPFTFILQALVSGLSAIGFNNVKDGVTGQSVGVKTNSQ